MQISFLKDVYNQLHSDAIVYHKRSCVYACDICKSSMHGGKCVDNQIMGALCMYKEPKFNISQVWANIIQS